MDPDLNIIREYALGFRTAILRCPKESLPVALRQFPKGSCGDASLLLAMYLSTKKLEPLQYIVGVKRRQSHAWLQLDDIIIDITADQFDESKDAVIVTKDDGWHKTFKIRTKHVADIGVYDRGTKMVLSSAYDAIMKTLL